MIGNKELDEMLERLREESLPNVGVPRPMLATALEDKDLDGLQFPLLGSPKIDGYRGLFWKGKSTQGVGSSIPAPQCRHWARKCGRQDSLTWMGS